MMIIDIYIIYIRDSPGRHGAARASAGRRHLRAARKAYYYMYV